MRNKDNRTDAEEAAANQTGGMLNQIKGTVKEVIGDVLDHGGLKREGMRDRVKGKIQEEYGELKEKETRLERELNDLEDGRV